MKVDLLVIGAGRAGTTTLCKYMELHPDIGFSAIKEVHYFSIADLNKRGEGYYHSFFNAKDQAKVFASADTYLLPDYEGIKRIKAYNPNMKVIVMLRNPIERAYSSYQYSVNYGYHDALESFTDCVEFEKGIAGVEDVVQLNNRGHLYASLYYKHISKWVDAFSKENILLLKTEDLKKDTESVFKKLCAFAAVDIFIPSETKQQLNAYAVPRNKVFEQFLLNRNTSLRKLIRNVVPRFVKDAIIKSKVVDKMHDLNRVTSDYAPLSKEDYNALVPYFKEDNESLYKHFGIRLL